MKIMREKLYTKGRDLQEHLESLEETETVMSSV